MVAGAGGPAVGVGPSAHATLTPGAPKRRRPVKRKHQRIPGEKRWLALVFLGPALILLAAIVVYPLIYSVIRSLYGDGPAGSVGSFIGLDNYVSIFTHSDTLRSVRNNVIWVIVVPTVVTFVGLVFAVLTERIRWATVLKTVLFMPMAISFLASGVTFSLVYNDQPSRGLANAVTVGIHDIFAPSSQYPTVHPRPNGDVTGSSADGFTTKGAYSPGSQILIPMVGLDLQSPPTDAKQAAPQPKASGLSGVVWNDFKLGGGGSPGKIDPGELGLPGVTVEALRGGTVAASTTTDATGAFDFPSLTGGSYRIALPASNFAPPFGGLTWLGPTLITPAIMIAYLWIYAGFAMVLLSAGMAAIPRDALEAARIDGATEWQVFRKVTVPLLRPVLIVVFVTMIINVLKVFDIVFVIQQTAGANGKYADVLAVTLYNEFANQKYGLASAIGVLLVVLVVPAIISNIKRFRTDQG